jgi:AmmeMemoRadiSam system protein A
MNEYLNEEQKKYLLKLAREAIETKLRTGKAPKVKVQDKMLLNNRGAFVTLKVDDELRGCIGYPLPYKPLSEAVVEMAIAAATQDYRFESLSEKDLANLKIEISVLTLPRPIKDIHEIEVGKHGIIVSKGLNKGLLLPQVPLEYNWDLETYLRHGCMKAGLDENEWKKNVQIEVFEAQVFSEE